VTCRSLFIASFAAFTTQTRAAGFDRQVFLAAVKESSNPNRLLLFDVGKNLLTVCAQSGCPNR
jgi:hypothetical protein